MATSKLKIIQPSYAWRSGLSKRKRTRYVVVHHSATKSPTSALQIHKMHQGKGWAGIGYHYYIRTDGTIEAGRPDDTVGAHCYGHNNESIGICFEGNYKDTYPNDKQSKSFLALCNYLKGIYGALPVVGHRDLMATECPGFNTKQYVFNIVKEENKCKSSATTAKKSSKS